MKLEEALPYIRRGCTIYRMGNPGVWIDEFLVETGFCYEFNPRDLFEDDWTVRKDEQ